MPKDLVESEPGLAISVSHSDIYFVSIMCQIQCEIFWWLPKKSTMGLQGNETGFIVKHGAFVKCSPEHLVFHSSPLRRLCIYFWDVVEKGSFIQLEMSLGPGQVSAGCYHYNISYSGSTVILQSYLRCLLESAFNIFCLFSQIKYMFNSGKVATPPNI